MEIVDVSVILQFSPLPTQIDHTILFFCNDRKEGRLVMHRNLVVAGNPISNSMVAKKKAPFGINRLMLVAIEKTIFTL